MNIELRGGGGKSTVDNEEENDRQSLSDLRDSRPDANVGVTEGGTAPPSSDAVSDAIHDALDSNGSGSSSDSEPEPGWVDDIPGAGAMIRPEDVAEIVDDRVTDVADQFSSGLEQTQEGFNRQIDEVESSIEDSFSGVSRGIESTQQSVASIPSSLAAMFNGESGSDADRRSGGDESDSGFPVGLAAAAVAAAAVVWNMTQN